VTARRFLNVDWLVGTGGPPPFCDSGQAHVSRGRDEYMHRSASQPPLVCSECARDAGICHGPTATVLAILLRPSQAGSVAVVHDVGTRLHAGRVSAVRPVRVYITITVGQTGVVKARAIGELVDECVWAVPPPAEVYAFEARTFVDPVQVFIQPIRVVVAESGYPLAVSVTVIGRHHR
jgi:hypothetical protein